MTFSKLFNVFLWKNSLFLRSNWLAQIIIFFGCAIVLIVYLRTTYELVSTPHVIYDVKSKDILKEYFPSNAGDDALYYAPEAAFTSELMEGVRRDLQLSAESLKPLLNETEMIILLEKSCQGNCFGVHFETFPDTAQDNFYEFKYSISSTAIRLSPRKRYVNDKDLNSVKDNDDYIRTGFFTLQYLVDNNYMKLRSGNNIDYHLDISAVPNIQTQTMDSQRMLSFGTIYSILFNVLLLSTFLVPLVEEKQNGIKEFLIVATPYNYLNGVTFSLIRLVLYILFFVVVLISAFIEEAIGIVPFIYVFSLFLLYTLSTMSYAYLISVCFDSVFYSKVGGLVFLFAPYVFYVVQGRLSHIATLIFSTDAFLECMEVFQTLTNKHRDDCVIECLFENVTEDTFKPFSTFSLLILQCILYALLYNYLSNIFPGPGGLKRPYLYFLRRSLYKKARRNHLTKAEPGADAIIIQDLVKRFKTPARETVIADHLNMAIKNRQITVLLGHNGAGKTTTLNMIMGFEHKDGGKIIVCSERDVSNYRHLIGFCPQHSVFMEYMTCRQHYQFFARLRGKSPKEALELTNQLLEQLHLEDKADEYGRHLSGGMKRRLSLGIAIAGDTKVIILDEPSSGLDVETRRELWDILLELRKKKAVLVTTHYMEEAEVLGDTICILANGRLQRTGSPLELKRKAGSGYILKLCTNESFKETETLALIQNREHIPTAYIMNTVPPTVLISLPYAYKANYSKMLEQLESKQKEFGIKSISVSDTSLEDVFLNCAAEDQVDARISLAREMSSLVPYERLDDSKAGVLRKFAAVAYKKSIYLRREWRYTLAMFLLPFLSAWLAIVLIQSMSMVESENPLMLNPSILRNAVVYVRLADEGNAQNVETLKYLTQRMQNYGLTVENLPQNVNTTVAQELINLQQKDLAWFLQHVLGAFVLDVDENGWNRAHIYFSGNVYHSSVILLNLWSDTLIKVSTKNPENTILIAYQPIRRFMADVSPTRLEYYAIIMSIGMFFSIFFYITQPYREHVSGFKNLQVITRYLYWPFMIFLDIVVHFCVCAFLFVTHWIIMPNTLFSTTDQLEIVAYIFFYGLSYLPILYVFANAHTSLSPISSYLLCMLVVSAIIPLLTSGNIQAMEYHEALITVLSVLPDFNLNHQLRVVNEKFLKRVKLVSLPESGKNQATMKAMHFLGSGRFFTFAVFTFIIVMVFLVCIWERKDRRGQLASYFKCHSCRQVIPKQSISIELDEGLVFREKSQVGDILKQKDAKDYPLVVSGLYKFYKTKLVVRDLNFVVRREECFGLLGVNGAGKSTAFQMMTANTTINQGSIKINGIDLKTQKDTYRFRFGYCPQTDCLNGYMTSYNMLKYIAMLRGVDSRNLENEIMYWMEKLDLTKYMYTQIRYYSGGTKRKVNAAVAMIGSPSLVFLDEPTTGVDPVSRRFLWNCIQEFQKRGKTVVLTSHSLDECEQLCNRLAIMVQGRLRCIGTIPELKLRYGTGFTIKMSMKGNYDDDNEVFYISRQIQKQFSTASLRENHAGMLTYFIKTSETIVWSSVFASMDKFYVKCHHLIEDYSVNECTLEDIFLKFDKLRKTAASPTASKPASRAESAIKQV